MKSINIGNSNVETSNIALGCMRIANMEKDSVDKLIKTALDEGITLFDHADIYGKGQSEINFGKVLDLKSSIRDKIVIQSKCGIRAGFFDFSKEYIMESVDNILKRLNTDYLDILLLHRPDTLMEPEEVAEAFSLLVNSGKVGKFGVSNHNPMQIQLLNKYLEDKIIVNQLQLSITNSSMIDCGLNVNMEIDGSINRDDSVLEFCRLNDITIQAWSPVQYGFFEGTFLNNPKFKELNEKLTEIGARYGVNNNTMAYAWLLRHPAKIQPVTGTTNIERLKEICKASDIKITREEWYEIYRSAGKVLP